MKTIETTDLGKIAIKVTSFLGRILVLLLTLLLCLPVVLLPYSTPIPVWVWVLLALADIVLLILSFGLMPAWRGITISFAGVIVVSIIAVVTSQFFAMTPPILDANGKPIPGSIATLEKVNLNGSQQWISIRGKDTNKPVLLFLAGGPGGSQLATERRALARLED